MLYSIRAPASAHVCKNGRPRTVALTSRSPKRLAANAADSGSGSPRETAPVSGEGLPLPPAAPTSAAPPAPVQQQPKQRPPPGGSLDQEAGPQRDIFIPVMVAVALVGYALVAVLAFLDQ
ncbi:hypothetical protein PLESTB_000567100 [Pleodorina starrii]|uniref:Uncharacterized protein n=1 Tax=Pleodorina starrii TaxID=330485 RepID=A0A9W6F0C2_9CHLO|nr:hypothetical protein PLESTM_000317500 [Pleodorina starrii]GLC51958.1 hypothetical protein PLESTB_000567100 [Pleodorina starrii]GLC68537.1 hypothetical protein PLESTF_000703000 [Pleodorina starrii]